MLENFYNGKGLLKFMGSFHSCVICAIPYQLAIYMKNSIVVATQLIHDNVKVSNEMNCIIQYNSYQLASSRLTYTYLRSYSVMYLINLQVASQLVQLPSCSVHNEMCKMIQLLICMKLNKFQVSISVSHGPTNA